MIEYKINNVFSARFIVFVHDIIVEYLPLTEMGTQVKLMEGSFCAEHYIQYCFRPFAHITNKMKDLI